MDKQIHVNEKLFSFWNLEKQDLDILKRQLSEDSLKYSKFDITKTDVLANIVFDDEINKP